MESPCIEWVYPRVGGGTKINPPSVSSMRGLSPRGRGNLFQARRGQPHRRSIPAWAGEPGTLACRRRAVSVYPRVGGGTLQIFGERKRDEGLSPRGRGNLLLPLYGGRTSGSIPAWAGEPRSPARHLPTGQVYPRVGGGTAPLFAGETMSSGLSPRGRGTLHVLRQRKRDERSIPAWAGEPTGARWTDAFREVYPRVGGGTSPDGVTTRTCSGLSPRGRGNRTLFVFGSISHRSIPAWAGEPDPRPKRQRPVKVYPRVGGGTPPLRRINQLLQGLSPRGRGNRQTPKSLLHLIRSIPAWAGEPRGSA